MGRLGVAAVAVALALAGWRNMPRLDHTSASAAGLMLALTCWLCYLAGRRLTRAQAWAAAVARAEATAVSAAVAESSAAAVSQVVVNVGDGAAAAGRRQFGGLESAPWIVGHSAAAIAADGDAWQDVVDQVAEDVAGVESG